jgi:hypothetical protein
MIVRLDLKKLPGDKETILENLFLLIELTLTMSTDPDVLTRTNKLYYHSSSDEGKGGKRRGKKGKARGRQEGKRRRRKDAEEDDEESEGPEDEDHEEEEEENEKKKPKGLSLTFLNRTGKSKKDQANGGSKRGKKKNTSDQDEKENDDDNSSSGDDERKHDSDETSDDDASPSARRHKPHGKGKRREGQSKHKRAPVVKGRALKSNADESPRDEVTLSCGWCKVSLHEVAQLESEKRFQEALVGGTPFVGEAIKSSEVKHRRHGWRAMLQTILGTDVRSQLDLLATPIPRLASDVQTDVYLLPPTFVTAASNVSLIRSYREILAMNIHRNPDNDMAVVAPGRAGAYSDPVLALFPRIMGDPAMRSVLHANWQRALKAMSMSQRADPSYCCNAFSNTVLDMWPAFSIYGARSSEAQQHSGGAEKETMESLRERTKVILQVTKTSNPFKDGLAAAASLLSKTQAPSATSLLSAKTMGPSQFLLTTRSPLPAAPTPPPSTTPNTNTAGSQAGRSAETNLYLAFHTKEICFALDTDI